MQAACASDTQNGETPGAGGGSQETGGTGGNASGGAASGGRVGTGGRSTGGAASGGTAGTGGKSTGGAASGGTAGAGGTGGDGGIVDADAGCGPGMRLAFRSPGCDGTAKATCVAVNWGDAAPWTVCLCNGTSTVDGGPPSTPYRNWGVCEDAATRDSSSD